MNNHRSHPLLLKCVKALGTQTSSFYTKIVILTIPNNIGWHIAKHTDGREYVAENYRTWSTNDDTTTIEGIRK